MTNQVRVSIIMPARNAGAYIAEALASILAQTEADLEVLVVDDASTDDTLTLARSFDDPRIRIFSFDEHRGTSAARNYALKVAQGEWITLLDADDWYAPDRLEQMLKAAEEDKADMVGDDVYVIRDGEAHPFTTQLASARRPIKDRFVVDPVSFIESDRPGLYCLRLGVMQPLFRHAFLAQHQLRYDESVWLGEDFHFYLQCLLAGARFVVLPQAYYYRRRHRRSTTAGDIILQMEHAVQVNARLLEDPRVQRFPEVVYALERRGKAVRSYLAFRQLHRALQSRSLWSALGQALRAPQFVPFLSRRYTDRLLRLHAKYILEPAKILHGAQ